ncbi:MAG: hypothetical protein ABEI80_06155 [Haloplanus sp.]
MTAHRDCEAPASSWWYLLALTPMVASLVAVVGVAVVVVATLDVAADLSTYGPAYFALAVMGLPLAVAYPLALYRDASAVAEQARGWSPDPRRYALAGAASVLTLFLLSVPLSGYYLRKRRQYVGTP